MGISLHPFWHLVGPTRWVGLDLWLLVSSGIERWLIASKAELAGVSHYSPRSACFNMASFCDFLGSVLWSSAKTDVEVDASIILTALHPAEHQLTDLKL